MPCFLFELAKQMVSTTTTKNPTNQKSQVSYLTAYHLTTLEHDELGTSFTLNTVSYAKFFFSF